MGLVRLILTLQLRTIRTFGIGCGIIVRWDGQPILLFIIWTRLEQGPTHFPVQQATRFSRNAEMPSWASCANEFMVITSFAYAYAFGRSRSICV